MFYVCDVDLCCVYSLVVFVVCLFGLLLANCLLLAGLFV